jgi:branched-chain amino acid transport system substrate-binding protein
MQKIKATGADCVFLGGITDLKGDQVIKDKVQVLGDNQKVKLIASDGFAQQSTITLSGAQNAAGMYMSASTLPYSTLKGAGKKFVAGFKSFAKIQGNIDPYAVYAAQAAEMMYQGLAKSDGTRPGLVKQLFATDLQNTILGTLKINQNGDTAAAQVTIYQASGNNLKVLKTIVPDPKLVKAAA